MTTISPGDSVLISPPPHAWRQTHHVLSGLILLALTLVMVPCPVTAEEPPAPPEMFEEMFLVPTSPVVLDGEILFQVRGVSAYPADTRAKNISERIEAFASDVSRSIQSLKIVEGKDATTIVADNKPLMLVINADGRLEGGIERQVLAQVYLKRIADAVEAHRETRKPTNLLFHILYTLIATAILASIGWGTQWMFNRFDAAIERRFKGQVKDLKIQRVTIFQSHQMWNGFRGSLRALRMVLFFLLLYAYLNFVFRQFPWTAYLGKQLFDIILDPLRVMGRGLLASIPSLVFLLILMVVLQYILKFGKLIFTNLARGKVTFPGFDQEWAFPTYKIFRILVIAFGVVMAYPYIPGSDTAAFKGVTLFMGVLLSLGSTSVIGNILAGYTLVYWRAFRVGDFIKINEHIGEVLESRLTVTHIRSLKNEEVIVPNSVILNTNVVNYSSMAREQGLILHRTVGIGYETPWRQVEAMLVEAGNRTSGLLKEPPPFVLQVGLGDFCVTYEINVYCDRPHDMMELYTLLGQNILDVFNEHGVQIMTPAYIADPEQPKIVPKDQWFTPPAKPPEKNQGK